MVMTPARAVLTYQDYAALPDDGRRYEIHEGELSVTPAPGSRHQIVSANLFTALNAHEGAPTLAVEILSPSTRGIERSTKLRLYASYGVPWYWIVDPDSRVVETYRLEAGSYTLSARVTGDEPLSAEPFPGLALAPASLWA